MTTDFANIPGTYTDELSDTYINAYLTFETKEEYLAWRTAWRNHYKYLSGLIRGLRKEWRAQGSDHDPMTTSQLQRARAQARSMLQLRHASKRRAQALYEQEKATAEVA